MWTIFPTLTRLYILSLLFVVFYTVFSLAKILIAIRGLRKRLPDSALESTVRTLADRLTNLNRLHHLFLLLFGACLADHLFAIIRSLQHQYMYPAADTVELFGPTLAFAFCVLLVLTMLHVLHWVVLTLLSPYTRTEKQLLIP
jgi:hypothetical protein